jgi:hypothetical protein
MRHRGVNDADAVRPIARKWWRLFILDAFGERLHVAEVFTVPRANTDLVNGASAHVARDAFPCLADPSAYLPTIRCVAEHVARASRAALVIGPPGFKFLGFRHIDIS